MDFLFRFFKEVRAINNTIKGKNFALGYQKNLNIFSDDKTQANMALLEGSAKTSIKTPFLFSSNKQQKANSILKVQTRAFSSETSQNQMEASFADSKEDVFISLEKEALLDLEITAHNTEEAKGIPKNILITGATGFVGKHLLIELLNTTDAHIYCLVREKSIEHAMKKLEKSLLLHGLWHKIDSARIIPVLGDVRKPFLGIQEAEFNRLSELIDSIYHSAAVINFDPYDALKQTNVIGTKEVLRFACAKKLKQVHHISTANVFNEGVCLNQRIINELTPIENEKHYRVAGYPSSKWVAERLVLLAMKRGIPCNIYRLGLVIWNDETGKCEENQWFYKLVKSCLMLHAFPTELNKLICMIPVNIAAKAIRSLSQQKATNKAYHIWEPKSYSLEDLSKIFHSETLIPLKHASEWLECLERYNNIQGELPITPILRGEDPQDSTVIKQRFMGIFNAPTFNNYISEVTWDNLPWSNTFTPFKGLKMFVSELYKDITHITPEVKQEMLLGYGVKATTISSLNKPDVIPITESTKLPPSKQPENVGSKPKVAP